MVKRIKLKTKAQTPAPKKDQIKGSKKNPAGSASSTRGKIEVSEKIEKSLKNMRDKHNDRYKSKSKKVDLGMLKSVYRRGAGAFSSSHRPNVTSRDQWSLARVKAFLKLVGTGERKKAYNTDLDLLPSGHPQKTEKKSESVILSIPKKYSHINFIPPKKAQENAKRALEIRQKKPSSQRGMTSTGIARARDISNGKKLSPDTLKRMLSYFQRHEIDKKGSTWKDQGKGYQAWFGWGGDAGFSFAKSTVEKMKRADMKNTNRAYSELIELSESKDYEVPDGLKVGKKFKTLSLGQVSSRMNGENVGNEITIDLLKELVRVYKLSEQESPVIIDWNHATSPFNQSGPISPDASNSLGIILDLELKEDGLYVVPAYNEKGLEVVKNAGGVLWSSPEYIDGNVYSRNGGDKVGNAQLLAITLTPRPAQPHNKISTVTLKESESYKMDDENKLEEMTLESAFEIINELKQKIQDMEASSKSAIMKKEYDDDKKSLAEKKDDDDDKNSLAEKKDDDDDKNSLAEKKDDDDDDDKKNNKMSESILLSEINQLKSLQSKSDLRIQELEAEKNEMKCNQSINVLLSEGKITPAEVDYAKEAFKLKSSNPKIWEMFQNRAANSHVNLSEIGHGASGHEINQKSLDQKIKDFAKDKSVTYSEALETIRSENPQYFNKFYGV